MPDIDAVVSGNGISHQPLISVIIPAYNCRRFLREAIESALSQTHRNIEVLVVDDGSTDGSPEIAKSYPVRFVQGTHQGVSGARNLGIFASHGDYLVFLDSDDRLLPNAVAEGLAALQQNPRSFMAVGAHNLISQTGDWLATRRKPCQLRDSYELLLRSNFIECTSSVLFRRSCFTDEDAFRPSLTGAEDYELYLRVARGAPMCCHSHVVSEYRLHPSSASRKSAMMLEHTLAVVAEQWPFARKSLRYRNAYLRGSLFWRRKYGRQLTVEMATNGTQWSAQENGMAWRLLARSYPQGILVVLISRILPKHLIQLMFQRA
jgi:glycosyltransferase involved in cell wall biosynthesis